MIVEVSEAYQKGFQDGILSERYRITNAKHPEINCSLIQEEVVKFYNIPWTFIISNSRKRPVALARQTYCYLVKRLTNLTSTDIAKQVNYSDHSGPIHCVQAVEDYMAFNEAFKNQILHLLNKLTNDRSSSVAAMQ